MKYITSTCFIVLVFLIFSSCKKDTKLSQSGANIVEAKINGVAWKAQSCWGCVGGGTGLRTVYLPDFGRLNILAQMVKGSTNTTIEIDLSQVAGMGKYDLKENGSSNNYAQVSDANCVVYYTTRPSSGSVTITNLDKDKKIISGSFEFSATSRESVTIGVTQGVFDVKY